MAYILSLFLCMIVLNSLQLGAPASSGECYDKEGNKYCCSDYEDQDDICVACSIGYTSREGSQCMKCENNRYGERCLEKCKCRDVERCDNVKGCVPNDTETTSGAVGQDVSGAPERENNKDSIGFSSNIWLLYSLGATALLLFLIIGLFCHRRKKTRTVNFKKEKQQRKDVEANEEDNVNPIDEFVLTGQREVLSCEILPNLEREEQQLEDLDEKGDDNASVCSHVTDDSFDSHCEMYGVNIEREVIYSNIRREENCDNEIKEEYVESPFKPFTTFCDV